MEILNNKEINYITGRFFLSDEDVNFNAKAFYISGINIFDELLCFKTQKDIGAVIHLIKYPKGLLIRLAKNFKRFETAISLSDIKIIAIENHPDFFLFHINTQEHKISFCSKNKYENDFLEFLEKFPIIPIMVKSQRDEIFYEELESKFIKNK